MEDTSKVSEDTTFNALKYKRYASTEIEVDGEWICAGSTYWINDAGQFHREDGPAIEWVDGSKFWCRNGELHREDGPAIEYVYGTKIWYQNGFKHREDGPAIEYANGLKEWFINGKWIRSE